MDYSHQLHHKKWPLNFDLLIPFLKFNQELERELLLNQTKVYFKSEKYIICESLGAKPIWAQDWWPNTRLVTYSTKTDAARILKSQKNLGVYYNSNSSALAANLRKEIREVPMKRIQYSVPTQFNFKFFAWTILDQENLLICDQPYSRFPLGWNEFNEDKSIPPNRAYLKLWEILCLGYISLKRSDIAIDLGSSPGGWTWALSEQVSKVYSVDKAPLDPKISGSPSIISYEEDAFKLDPQNFKDATWLFSDIICTPERLYQLVTTWMKESSIKNFVCTIKFKGPCDFEMLKKFNEIENSKIIHLYQNKNEVTWIKQGSAWRN